MPLELCKYPITNGLRVSSPPLPKTGSQTNLHHIFDPPKRGLSFQQPAEIDEKDHVQSLNGNEENFTSSHHPCSVQKPFNKHNTEVPRITYYINQYFNLKKVVFVNRRRIATFPKNLIFRKTIIFIFNYWLKQSVILCTSDNIMSKEYSEYS